MRNTALGILHVDPHGEVTDLQTLEMYKRLTQLRALSAQEWRILISSQVLLPFIALALRLKGFKWTRAFLQRRIPEPSPKIETPSTEPEDALLTARSVARMVAVAANHGLYRANCLKRSLATWWLLQRRGIEAELNIGVNRDSGEFNAHAWVEYSGHTLVEADDITERYSSFGPQ